MRVLHPVAAHERFVGRGVYAYYPYESERSEQHIQIQEAWTIHALEGGAHFIRVDYDARAESGVTLLVEVLLNPDQQIERFNIMFDHTHPDIPIIKADYTPLGDYVQIGRRIGKGERDYHELALPPNCVILPPSTLFLGRLARLTQEVPVFSVAIRSDQHGLDEIISTYGFSLLGTDQLSRQGKAIPTTVYKRAGELSLWVDEHHIPLRLIDYYNHRELVQTGYAHI